jgi:hypothetical protein
VRDDAASFLDGGSADAESDTGGPAPRDAAADAAENADADAAGAPDCVALAASVDRARKDARACELGKGQCLSALKDQCDCDVVIAVPGSSKAIAFESAVSALRASGCPKGCAASCAPSTPRNCLQQLGDVVCVP